MEKVLSFAHDGKGYTSKPLDFEAMCMINEAHNDKNLYGPLMICRDAVDYLFEGIVSQEVMKNLDVSIRTYLCIELWGFYAEVLQR